MQPPRHRSGNDKRSSALGSSILNRGILHSPLVARSKFSERVVRLSRDNIDVGYNESLDGDKARAPVYAFKDGRIFWLSRRGGSRTTDEV